MYDVSKRVHFHLHTSYILFSDNVVVWRLVLSRVDRCVLLVSHRIVGCFDRPVMLVMAEVIFLWWALQTMSGSRLFAGPTSGDNARCSVP